MQGSRKSTENQSKSAAASLRFFQLCISHGLTFILAEKDTNENVTTSLTEKCIELAYTVQK
jgi:hypothetical protein